MPTNFYWFFIAALVPLMVGSLYYGPILGKAWMSANNLTEEDLNDGRLPRILALTYVMGLFIAFFMPVVAIHQGSVFALMMPEVMESGSAAQATFNGLMADYGSSYRSFSHGAIHGVMLALLLVWPVLSINAMFERAGWRYVAIHVGYWVVTLSIMGGLLCQFLDYPLPS